MYLTLNTENLETYMYIKLRRKATKEEVERLAKHMDVWFKRWPEIADGLIETDPQFKIGEFNPLPIIENVEAK